MCTIGIVYDHDNLILFKQCDLDKETTFKEPTIVTKNDTHYLTFEKSGDTRPWCGVNQYGVAFIATDTYLAPQYSTKLSKGTPFEAYENIISTFKTAKEASEYMKKYYTSYLNPDTLIISDSHESYYIETYNKEFILVQLKPEPLSSFFVATNHFRFIHGGIEYTHNHSTHLRLQRAEQLLLQNSDLEGVKQLLCDQYYGESVLSICREKKICPKGEPLYWTQATAILVLNPNHSKISCYYQINGNPLINKLIYLDDIFNEEAVSK